MTNPGSSTHLRRIHATGIFCALLLAACSAPPSASAPQPPSTIVAASPSASAPVRTPLIPPLTLEGYKKSVADRVARASPDVFGEPLPEVFKSIVVLDITIDRNGGLSRVAVRRSNGHKALEDRAMDSVRRAAPFGVPALTVRGRDGSVNFLETFLFRDDGRFRILSLVR